MRPACHWRSSRVAGALSAVNCTTHLQAFANQWRRIIRRDLRPRAENRIDRMIRGRVVARMGNQEVCREKRTNRDLGPPVRGLRIGRCGGAARGAAVEENLTIAPSIYRVKQVCARLTCGRSREAVDNCARGSRTRGQGRGPRGGSQRGTRGSAGGATRSALSARPANRTIEVRRPMETGCRFSARAGMSSATPHSPARLDRDTRGVSDLCCGRGRDRKSGQKSWSLTPPSCV